VEDEVFKLAQVLWETMLGLTIERSDDRSLPEQGGGLCACVQIVGSWEGSVLLRCDSALARHLAASALKEDPQQLTAADVQDALGELANILAGNIKMLLPRPSRLSLPVVVDGASYELSAPGTHPILEMAFLSEGQPVEVRILRREV
jgi:chemotaxis protein CheX